METIHQRLRFYRTNKGMTIAEVSLRTKIPASTYKEWENGRQIRGEPYLILAETFDVSLHELVTGKKKESRRVLEKLAQIERDLAEVQTDIIAYF